MRYDACIGKGITMLHLAICDDEIKFCEQYKEKVQHILGDGVQIQTYTAPRECLKSLKQGRCDILLLDIDMPELTGLQMASVLQEQEINPKPILIFVTSQDAFVYESFRYHPFGFIRKNYIEEELEPVLLEAVEEWKKGKKQYTFRCEDEMVTLLYKDILYLEAKGNYLEIHATGRIYRIRETLVNAEKELKSWGFVRIHRGFLVNQQAVYRLGANEVVLQDKTILPIGRSCKEQARESLMRYMMA